MSLKLTKMKRITEVNSEKLTFATFMERSIITVNPTFDQTFAPLKANGQNFSFSKSANIVKKSTLTDIYFILNYLQVLNVEKVFSRGTLAAHAT